jgi:hypothetical protein
MTTGSRAFGAAIFVAVPMAISDGNFALSAVRKESLTRK